MDFNYLHAWHQGAVDMAFLLESKANFEKAMPLIENEADKEGQEQARDLLDKFNQTIESLNVSAIELSELKRVNRCVALLKEITKKISEINNNPR